MAGCFKWGNPGTATTDKCCGPCNGTLTVTVDGACGGGVRTGASVSIATGGSTVATGTSDGSGVVTFTGLDAGTYTITTSLTGYDTDTSTVTVSCGATTTTTVVLNVSIGFTCCHCPDPVPNTLYATVGGSTVTLSGPNPWVGSVSKSVSNCTGGTISKTVAITLNCPASTGAPWTLRASASACSHLVAGSPDHADVYWACATCNSGACTVFSDSTVSGCPSPLSLSFTMGATNLSACLFVGDPGQTFTDNLGTPPWGTTIPVTP